MNSSSPSLSIILPNFHSSLFSLLLLYRLLPRALCCSQRLYRFSDDCSNGSLTGNYLAGRYTLSQSSLLFSKQLRQKCLLPLKAVVASENQVVTGTQIIGDDKIGVLLLNLGGPETLDDVQPFLFNLFADPVKLNPICLFFRFSPFFFWHLEFV